MGVEDLKSWRPEDEEADSRQIRVSISGIGVDGALQSDRLIEKKYVLLQLR